ncbi:PAS domain-containing protein [Cystobacter fuscus]
MLRCNTRAAALLGVEAERLRGQEPWTAAPGLMGRTLHERLVAALESRQPARFLASLPPRTWLEVSVVPVSGELWVLATDITQREEAQALVEQTEKRFRLLGERFQVALDSAQMAVWETNLATGRSSAPRGMIGSTATPSPCPRGRTSASWRRCIRRTGPRWRRRSPPSSPPR